MGSLFDFRVVTFVEALVKVARVGDDLLEGGETEDGCGDCHRDQPDVHK